MAIPSFNPPIGPSPGTAHKRGLKILEADFGDGYGQSAPDGINHIRRTTNLKWSALTYEQYLEIDAFFLDRKGTNPFYFMPFGEPRMLKWTCKEFGGSTDEGIWSYTATIVQSFTLAS